MFKHLRTFIVLGGLALGLMAASAIVTDRVQIMPLLLFNPSASMPLGFYLRERAPLAQGAIVSLESARIVLADEQSTQRLRRWRRVLKRVAASEDDHVCADGGMLLINARAVAPILAIGSDGAPLYFWSGCRTLKADEVMLLGESQDSFDGRYWGPVRTHLLEAQWRPLLTWRAKPPTEGQRR